MFDNVARHIIGHIILESELKVKILTYDSYHMILEETIIIKNLMVMYTGLYIYPKIHV